MEPSETIWYDEMNDQYFKIDNHTGQSKKVYKTGDFIKEFDACLTGQVDYKQRIEKAGNRQQYYPHQPKSLHYDKNNTYYTPQNEKFLGYCQFGYPRCEPYFNDRNTIKNFTKNKKLNQMIYQVKKKYSPLEMHNKSLYKFKSNQNTMVSYLTGSKRDLEESEKKQKIEVLKQRSNTALREYQKGVVKMINNQKLSEPNLSLYDRKMKSSDTKYRIKTKKMDDYNQTQDQFLKTLEQSYTLGSSQQKRYKKRKGRGKKQLSNTNDEVVVVGEYEKFIDKEKEFETTRIKKQFDALQNINTRTYEKKLQDIDLESVFKKQQMKKTKDYKQVLKREQQELDCFQVNECQYLRSLSRTRSRRSRPKIDSIVTFLLRWTNTGKIGC